MARSSVRRALLILLVLAATPSLAHADRIYRLVTALQPGGVLIWLYNVTPGRVTSGWRHHSLRDVRAHFAAYPTAQIAFSLRLDAWLPSRVLWSPLWTRIANRLARLFRLGGELIVILTAPGMTLRSRDAGIDAGDRPKGDSPSGSSPTSASAPHAGDAGAWAGR
jgi:hypothetical protein